MKQMLRKMRKAKGFTLIELLIVIIIIGILAGMMMLSMGSATDKANATKVVSDLRNLKAAMIMCYADNGNKWPTTDNVKNGSLDYYLDRDMNDNTKITINEIDGAVSLDASSGFNGVSFDSVQKGVGKALKGMETDAAITVVDKKVTMPISGRKD